MLAVKWWDCLKAVRHAPISRKDLAQVCGISESSAKRWVREGLAQGELVEVPSPRDAFDSRPGRGGSLVVAKVARNNVEAHRPAGSGAATS